METPDPIDEDSGMIMWTTLLVLQDSFFPKWLDIL